MRRADGTDRAVVLEEGEVSAGRMNLVLQAHESELIHLGKELAEGGLVDDFSEGARWRGVVLRSRVPPRSRQAPQLLGSRVADEGLIRWVSDRLPESTE
jgi:hypothetical protein